LQAIKGELMLIKLLKKVLSKCFRKKSPEENEVRKSVLETKGVTTEKKIKGKKRRIIMADEKEVKKVEVEETETEKKDVVDKKDTDVAEKVEDTKDEKVEDVEDKDVKDEVVDDVDTKEALEVDETEPVGNGIRIEDVVTKDVLADRLSAFEAKLDAILKENEDLKNRLSAKDDELNGMKDKYENNDFGNYQKKGTQVKDKLANSSFDEYSKAFM
jgi:hypothetical protein